MSVVFLNVEKEFAESEIITILSDYVIRCREAAFALLSDNVSGHLSYCIEVLLYNMHDVMM